MDNNIATIFFPILFPYCIKIFPHEFRDYDLGKYAGPPRSKTVNTDTIPHSPKLSPNAKVIPLSAIILPTICSQRLRSQCSGRGPEII